MFFLVNWFVTIIYQPFFNLLVGIYYLLGQATHGNADMGIAVVIFTVVFRILWIPVSLASGRSYKEQLEITKKIKEVEETFAHDPVALKTNTKAVFKNNKRTVFFSTINIALQVMIALMLWFIFAKGLKGESTHLLYPFMPKFDSFNLGFLNLGNSDPDFLSKPSLLLNFIQSLVIFIFETLSAIFSINPVSRREALKAQFFLPVISFAIFWTMPAGKKLFIITTLLFSCVQLLLVQVYYWIVNIKAKFETFGPKATNNTPNPVSSSPPPSS